MAQFGALLVDGGVLAAASNAAYAFGTGDFSLEILVQSMSPGTLISCMGNGGAGAGGFLLAIETSGVLKFVTSDGTSTYEATSGACAVLDGDWHHVAGVRQSGALTIYFDGAVIPTVSSGTGTSPLNVSNALRLVIGGTDDTSEPAGSLSGTVDDVAIWSRALTPSDIITGMFERIVPSSSSLVGYWTLEDSLQDSSVIGNDLVADGDVEFILVSHWTTVDFGAQLTGNGVIFAPTNAVYNVGTGDFTVGAYVQTTTPGTIISRQGPLNGAGYGGFLLTLEPDGQIKFATTDGTNLYQTMTGATPVFDGSWHHVAGARVSGALTIFLDGQAVPSTTSGDGTTPLDINSAQQLVMGGTDDPTEPSNQIRGWLYDVCIWNVGLTASDLEPWLFGQLTGDEAGLVGYYSLDDTTDDLSGTGNNATANASVSFGVIYGGLQTAGSNSYAYCAITSDPPPVVLVARGIARSAVGDPPAIERQESVVVQAGSPALVAALNTPGDDVVFPTGVTLTVTDPNGLVYNSQANSATVYVVTGVGNSIAQLIILNPITGTWIVTVTGPADARFQCQVTALPSQNVVATMQSALGPMYPEDQASLLRLVRHAALRGDVSWSCWWCVVGAMAVAVVVGALLIVISAGTAGGGFLVALGAVATLCGYVGTAAGAAMAGALILSMSSGSVGLIAEILCMYMGPCTLNDAPSLQTVVNNICTTVGVPARMGAQATRANAGIDADYPITIDAGGEGPKPWDNSTHFGSMVVGFANAINLNDKTETTGGPPTRNIPLLVQVTDWSTNPGYPFASGFANYVTMQSAPLTATGVTEMARIIAPGGRIGLWIDVSQFATQITQLATALNSTAQYNAPDEFNGNAGYPKTLIVNRR